jgi:hypothetical protein
MIGMLQERRMEIAALCEKYGVKRLDLFGSAAGDGFDPEASDLDFIVSFEERDPRISSIVTLASKKTWRISSGATWTSLRRAHCSRTRTSPRTSRGRGCRFMRPERTPRPLRQIADACSFVLSVTEGKTLRRSRTTPESVCYARASRGICRSTVRRSGDCGVMIRRSPTG